MTAKLIQASELYEHLNDTEYLIFDVRHNLSDPKFGRKSYKQAHIPGALFLDCDSQLCSVSTGTNGRHPLPERGDFAELMRNKGLDEKRKVIIYDSANSAISARLWWMLRWLGHDDIAILDGGWAAWQEINGPIQTDTATVDKTNLPSSAEFSAKPGMPVVEARNIMTNLDEHRFTVLDARAKERFSGANEPIDPIAGHIPGAICRPFTANLQANNHFKSAQDLRQEFETLLGNRLDNGIVHQCGSGITACHNLFAMEYAGLRGSALYPGSWSEWCSNPSRPVATGD